MIITIIIIIIIVTIIIITIIIIIIFIIIKHSRYRFARSFMDCKEVDF